MPESPTFDGLLRKAAPEKVAGVDIQQAPGVAFRALYDGWVKLGGYVRGKPRRSVRLIKIWLDKKHEVRSIETKLAGKTPMQRDDIANLLWLFLNRWRYDDDHQEDRPFDYDDLDRLVDELTEEIYVPNAKGQRSGLLLPRRGRSTTNETRASVSASSSAFLSNSLNDTFASGDKIVEFYRETDALTTISRQRTFIGADPGTTMVGFHALMDRLRAIDEEEKSDRFRALIWIVDAGRREGDTRSQGALHNLDFLATQFRSLLLTDHPARERRTNWFLKRAIVMIGTLRLHEIDACYHQIGLEPEVPQKRDNDWVTADRLFFEGLPDDWLERVVRHHPESIRQRTVTVHRDLNAEKTGRPGEADWQDLHFLFHMPLADQSGKLSARCVDLPRPGVRWCNGIRLAHEVALLRLGRRIKPTLPSSPEEGLSLLKDHRFAALTASEFCQLSNRLAFEKFE